MCIIGPNAAGPALVEEKLFLVGCQNANESHQAEEAPTRKRALGVAELRLALISLALKPAYRHLSRRLPRIKLAEEDFESNRQFWAIIFSKA